MADTVTRPRIADLFCGAGGSARGLQQAGFYVVGFDIKPQPHYIGDEFHIQDALTVDLSGFDAVWASPPCQAYSRATAWRGDRLSRPNLIGQVQDVLRTASKPYIIENVQEARRLLKSPLMLCGTMFGENFQSHRYFEVNFPVVFFTPALCHHTIDNVSRDHGKKYPESVLRDTLGCTWMNVHEAREAIPPVYSEFLGKRLMEYLHSMGSCRRDGNGGYYRERRWTFLVTAQVDRRQGCWP